MIECAPIIILESLLSFRAAVGDSPTAIRTLPWHARSLPSTADVGPVGVDDAPLPAALQEDLRAIPRNPACHRPVRTQPGGQEAVGQHGQVAVWVNMRVDKVHHFIKKLAFLPGILGL